MSARVERDQGSGRCVVHLQGEVDVAAVPQVRAALDDVVDAGCQKMVIDLSAVTYIDSSMLRVLIWLGQRLEKTNAKVVLAGADADVTRILELSGLIRYNPRLSMAADVEAASDSFDLVAPPGAPLRDEKLTMHADPQSLASARNWVVELVRPFDLGEHDLFDLKVAVGEALANAVLHASPHGDHDEIEVEVRLFDDRVVVDVDDRGHTPFEGLRDPTGWHDPHGRGVGMMGALVDDVRFSASPAGGTRVTLTKHRPRH